MLQTEELELSECALRILHDHVAGVQRVCKQDLVARRRRRYIGESDPKVPVCELLKFGVESPEPSDKLGLHYHVRGAERDRIGPANLG